MKKIFSVLVLLFMCAGMVKAEVILAPQWGEFCPSMYLNAQPAKFDKDKNYWYERRMQFNEMMKQASQYQGQDLKDFYEQVRQSEEKKNEHWAAEVRAHNERVEREQQRADQLNTIYSIQSLIRTFK